MAVSVTIFEVVSTGQEYSVPGDRTPEQLVAAYSANVPGLSGMQSEVTFEDDGATKRVVFRPRTGTKG